MNPKKLRYVGLLVAILLGEIFNPSFSSAQETNTVKAKTASPFIERASVRTNALEWLLTVPNVQFGYDLFSGPYNRSSLLFGLKWKPTTGHFYWDSNENLPTFREMPSFFVFSVFDTRAEYRRHFRFRKKPADKPFKFFSLERSEPRPWIAHYLGGYLDYSTYSINPAGTGRQGWQIGTGVSYGIELPYYEFNKSAIDIELGASIGITVATFQTYKLNYSETAYCETGDPVRTQVWPVVSELRATFSWRKESVRNKYTKVDPEIKIMADMLADIRMGFEGTNKQMFDDSRDKKTRALYAQNDSLYRADFVSWVRETENELIEGVNSEYTKLNAKRKASLCKEVRKLGKNAVLDFDNQIRAKQQEALAKQREEEAKQREAEKARKKKEEEE